MKIITWNINSLRLSFALLKTLIEQYNPDIVALQETKVHDSLFPLKLIQEVGYDYVAYRGQKSYNGVTILSKIPFTNSLSLKLYNEDSRHISIMVQGIELHNFYVPAGGDIPDVTINTKFQHKMEYIGLMREWFINNRNKNDKIVLMGDLNIAPLEHDVWSSKQLRNVVSHTDIERAELLNLQHSLGFVDSARHFIPSNEKAYSKLS